MVRASPEGKRLLEEQWCQPLRDADVPYRTLVARGDPVHELLHTARKPHDFQVARSITR